MNQDVLVLLAHGTADPRGQTELESLRVEVAARLPGIEVRLAFVDVIGPTPGQALHGTTGAVLVPLFLASGHHVQVDVPAASDTARGARSTPALGPHPFVVEAVAERVTQTAPTPSVVVLAAAGSSRAKARAEVDLAARRLSLRLGVPVIAAFLSGPGTTVEEAIEQARAVPGRGAWAYEVVVAAHLLAPGFFHDKAARVAAQHGVRCTEPIGAHERIVDLVLHRYLAASTTLKETAT